MLERRVFFLFNSFIFVWRTISGKRRGLERNRNKMKGSELPVYLGKSKMETGRREFLNRENFVLGKVEKEVKNSM